MKNSNGKFRKVLVLQDGHDFSALENYTDDIVFVTTGEETVRGAALAIREALEEFDPDTDAIVPVGKIAVSFLAGMLVTKMFPGKEITIGLYQSKLSRTKEYKWLKTK